jgi:hypothetical protein
MKAKNRNYKTLVCALILGGILGNSDCFAEGSGTSGGGGNYNTKTQTCYLPNMGLAIKLNYHHPKITSDESSWFPIIDFNGELGIQNQNGGFDYSAFNIVKKFTDFGQGTRLTRENLNGKHYRVVLNQNPALAADVKGAQGLRVTFLIYDVATSSVEPVLELVNQGSEVICDKDITNTRFLFE